MIQLISLLLILKTLVPSDPDQTVFLRFNCFNALWTSATIKGIRLKALCTSLALLLKCTDFAAECGVELNRNPEEIKCSFKQFNISTLSLTAMESFTIQDGHSYEVSEADNDLIAFQNFLGSFTFSVVIVRWNSDMAFLKREVHLFLSCRKRSQSVSVPYFLAFALCSWSRPESSAVTHPFLFK